MAYIRIDRKIFKNFLWTERRPFSKFEAWLDLIQLVSYTNENKHMICGQCVSWNRGEFPISRSFLAERWLWSEAKIRCFLKMLQNNQMIITKTTGKTTILTLCNYDKYNELQPDEDTGDDTEYRPADSQITARIKRNKEDKINKENNKSDKPTDFIDQIINSFIEIHGSYEVLNKGKERKAAAKILGIYKKKYPTSSTEETLEGLRSYFKSCININDSWLRTNMSLSLIVSKFNEINTIIKNGSNKESGASDQALTELIYRKISGQQQ